LPDKLWFFREISRPVSPASVPGRQRPVSSCFAPVFLHIKDKGFFGRPYAGGTKKKQTKNKYPIHRLIYSKEEITDVV